VVVPPGPAIPSHLRSGRAAQRGLAPAQRVDAEEVGGDGGVLAAPSREKRGGV